MINLAKKSRNELSINSYEGILHLILNWDPNREEFKDKQYLYGFKGGLKYMFSEFEGLSAEDYFKQTKCFLMPPKAGADTKDFVIELSQLIKTYLFNIDEMPVKKSWESRVCLTPDQLISHLRETVLKINARIVDNIQTNGYNFRPVCETNEINSDSEDPDSELFDNEVDGQVERDRTVSTSSSIEVLAVQLSDLCLDEEQPTDPNNFGLPPSYESFIEGMSNSSDGQTPTPEHRDSLDLSDYEWQDNQNSPPVLNAKTTELSLYSSHDLSSCATTTASEVGTNQFSGNQMFDTNPKTIYVQTSNELVEAVDDKSSNPEDNGIKDFVEIGVEAEERIDSNDSREETFDDLTPDVNHFAAEETKNQRSDLIQSLKVCENDQYNFFDDYLFARMITWIK